MGDYVEVYNRQLNNTRTGASNINPRVVIGALMVKHLLNLSDRDTILAIQENIYIQHFLGFDNIIYDALFNTSLFVEIRKRMGMAELEKINDMIYRHSMAMTDQEINISQDKILKDNGDDATVDGTSLSSSVSDFKESGEQTQITHSGRMLVDATACPQDIAYPTDIKILNASREQRSALTSMYYMIAPYLDLKNQELIERMPASSIYSFLRKKFAVAGASKGYRLAITVSQEEFEYYKKTVIKVPGESVERT